MNNVLDSKLDISNQEFDLLVEWLRSQGFEVQTEFEIQMAKPEDVPICPMSDPTGMIEFVSYVQTND